MKNKTTKKDISKLSKGYLRLSQILLFCGILLTGLVMLCSTINTYTNSAKNTFQTNCTALIANIQEGYGNKYWIPNEQITSLLQTAEQEYDYLVYLYDENGDEIYPHQKGMGKPLAPSVKPMLRNDVFMKIGYYSDKPDQPELCCAMQFDLRSTEGTDDRFYLAAVSKAGNLVSYATRLAVQLVISMVLSMMLFMLLFRIGANRLDRQFEKLNAVVEQYAEGEFSARVEIPEQNELYPFGCTLNRMAEFIEQNETTRKNFVANVSHELRTPMTTIGGFADGILDGTIPPEQHEKYTRIIADEIHRLRTLVNSMLNLSKFEAGEMQLRLKQFDVGQLLIKTVLMFEKRITEKNVEVEGLESSSLQLLADEDLLFQVFYNLIENAVKFVNKDGIISFDVHKENGTAYILVKNTGEGLSDDELTKVFDRFYKTDASRSKDKTGLGLGLSIARKIVHLHEGHIVVKSVQGEYTAFEIQLPIKG